MAWDFTKAASRVRELIATKPSDLSRSAITPKTLRDNVIAEGEDHVDHFGKTLREQPSIKYNRTDEDGNVTQEFHDWTSFPECIRDVARGAFDDEHPKMLPPEQIRASHQLNREVEESYFNSPEFEDANAYTSGQVGQSLFSAAAAADKLTEAARTHLAEHIARSEQMAEQEQAAQSAQDLMDKLRKKARKEHADSGEVSDDTKRDVKGALKQRQAARERLGQLLNDQDASSMVLDARAAGQAAAEAANDMAEAFSMLPGVDPGSARNVDADTQLELMREWMKNPQLQRILKDLGRWVRDWKFKRSARTKNVKVEPVGVTTGRDLDLLLPHELARAYIPELRPIWMKDFSERNLLQYQMEGKEPAGEGPIITCCDGSLSMWEERFIYASSLNLTLAVQANKDKRAFAGIEFGSASEMKSWYFPAGEPQDPRELLDMTSHFFGGGTSIVTGMREALRMIREEPAFETADVVLISDGADQFGSEDKKIRDELRECGVRIHGISIQTPGNHYCEQMCDYVVDVEDLAQGAPAELAENIIP